MMRDLMNEIKAYLIHVIPFKGQDKKIINLFLHLNIPDLGPDYFFLIAV
jgi:hypothetical protein